MNEYTNFKKTQAVEVFDNDRGKYRFAGFVKSDLIKEKKQIRQKKYSEEDEKGNLIYKYKDEYYIPETRKKEILSLMQQQITNRINDLKKQYPRIRKLGASF